MIANWIMIILTLAIACFTWLVWKVYRRIAGLTGAMESHSTIMLRIEAERGIKNKPIKIIWWDPTIKDPPFTGKHGEEAELEEIRLFLPPKYRQKKTSKLKALFY